MNCCHHGISGFAHATNCHVRFGREEGREWDDDDFVNSDETDCQDEESENDCDD